MLTFLEDVINIQAYQPLKGHIGNPSLLSGNSAAIKSKKN
jgi:hypothetical protein